MNVTVHILLQLHSCTLKDACEMETVVNNCNVKIIYIHMINNFNNYLIFYCSQ